VQAVTVVEFAYWHDGGPDKNTMRIESGWEKGKGYKTVIYTDDATAHGRLPLMLRWAFDAVQRWSPDGPVENGTTASGTP
jgi:hypothetical protein